jgi:excisionase family DNA binding protein
MSQTTDQNLLTIGEVAQRIGCSRMHVYRLIRSGALVPVDIALPGARRTRYRCTAAALDDYLRHSSYDVRGAGDADAV